MHLRRDFQAEAVQADEAGGVVLVVGLGRVGFHRGVHCLFKQRRQISRAVEHTPDGQRR